ncbi:MAG: hypothetical protein GY827_00070 [Cytophagales bacterium]|nr:hypothetical protein [Cytophagales bacterium]
MKHFIKKNIFFLLPIIILYVITKVFYNHEVGDLLRVGFIFNDGTYRNSIENRFTEVSPKREYISKINLKQKQKFDVLTIGDSFSEQGKYDYNNYITKYDDISMIHFDRNLHPSTNPLQTLNNVINGNILDKLDVNFIILQSVERHIVRRTHKLDTLQALSLDSLCSKIEKKTKSNNDQSIFFSDLILKAPLTSLMYAFYDNPHYSKTYKVKTATELFTDNSNELLFYKDDLGSIKINNDTLGILKLNTTLNQLHHKLLNKGIQLIILPSPDKYDAYYQFIMNKEKYPEPIFFKYFNTLPKEYHCIDTKKIINTLHKAHKDVYYYDDTHWSPITAEVIGNEIAKIIKPQNTEKQ